MRRIVLVFGLIAGVILSVFMITSATYSHWINSEYALVIGYTSMVLAFLLVYFGIRSYRDNVAGGVVTFGKAFTVGISITLIACLCYVVAWEFVYHNFFPDFMDKYAANVIEKARASGAPQAKVDATVAQMEKMKEMYRNPFFRMAETFIEAFPVGLLFTLLSAALLKRKSDPLGGAPTMAGASPMA